MTISVRAWRRLAATAVAATAAGCCALVLPGLALPSLALAAPAAPARSAPRATVAPCETPGLVVWLDTNGNGTAGSVWYTLGFTNLSGHRCTLNGFPYVTAASLAGDQLGRRAAFDHLTPHSVTLARGQTGHALLQVVDTGALPLARCKPVTAAGLRVYPPNQTRARSIPFPFSACSARRAVFLRVRPVTK